MVIGEGIHGEGDTLSLLHTTDVGLVDISNHAHIGQVLCNGEELRGVERSGHGLTLFHGFRQYHTVDRTGDGGIAQVGLCLLHTLAGGVHLFLGLEVRQFGCLIFIGAHQPLVEQRLVAVEIRLLVVQRALCRRQVGLCRLQFTGQVGLVKFGDDLTLLHHGVVVNIELGYDTADLCTYGDGGNGFDGTCCSDGTLDTGTFHLCRLERNGILFLSARQEVGSDSHDSHNGNDDGPSFFVIHILSYFYFVISGVDPL